MIIRRRKHAQFNAVLFVPALAVVAIVMLWFVSRDLQPTSTSRVNLPDNENVNKSSVVDHHLYKDDKSKQISRTNKLVYIHIPKTGGSTVEESSLFDDHRIATGRKAAGHYRVAHIMDDVHKYHLEGYSTATTVRNPVDRFVSAFYYSKRGPPSHSNHAYYKTVDRLMGDVDNVTAFVQKLDAEPGLWRDAKRSYIHLVPMTYWVVYEGRSEFGIDVVMCQEDWMEGIKRLLRTINATTVPKGIIQHKRLYGNQQIEQLNNNTVASILRNYALDACLFGYSDIYNPPTNSNGGKCIGSVLTRPEFTQRLQWCKRNIKSR